MARDPSLSAAVGVVGVHSDTPSTAKATTPVLARLNKTYWRSENNVCDTPFPKWENAFAWMVSILDNYVTGRATCTILCPILHSWSMNWGRHLHGHSEAIEPWSGFYKLGAPFWAQAHLTQTTRLGWLFLDGDAKGKISCSGVEGGKPIDQAPTPLNADGRVLIWTTVMAPDGEDFTLVIVNQCADVTMRFALAGSIVAHAGKELWVRRSNETDWFAPQPNVSVDSDGTFTVRLAAQTMHSFTTAGGASRLTYEVPRREPAPLPYESQFAGQPDQQQGHRLDAIYGTFEVNPAPEWARDTRGRGHGPVLRQSVPVNPGSNAWGHRKNGLPFTALPSGYNFANVVASVRALMPGSGNNDTQVRLCGRVPIWQPSDSNNWAGLGKCSIGVCLQVFASGTFFVTEHGSITQAAAGQAFHASESCAILAQGAVSPQDVSGWFNMSLNLTDYHVRASINSHPVASTRTTLTAGVVGLGTGWHLGYFDELVVAPSRARTPGSWWVALTAWRP